MRVGVAAALGAIACGGSAPVDEDGCVGDPSLEVGTGKDAFEPVDDGDSVVIQHGPQGGWHIWTGIHSQGTSDSVSILPGVDWPALADAGSVHGPLNSSRPYSPSHRLVAASLFTSG